VSVLLVASFTLAGCESALAFFCRSVSSTVGLRAWLHHNAVFGLFASTAAGMF